MEKFAEYCLEQSQKNTTQLFDAMKNTFTNSVEMVNFAQGELQQVAGRLTQQGMEQFVTQLEKIQEQQLSAQKDFQEQFHNLLTLFKPEEK